MQWFYFKHHPECKLKVRLSFIFLNSQKVDKITVLQFNLHKGDSVAKLIKPFTQLSNRYLKYILHFKILAKTLEIFL